MKKTGLAIICSVILSLLFASVSAHARSQEVIEHEGERGDVPERRGGEKKRQRQGLPMLNVNV